ncbi:MAG: type II toxin-antitoxin system RelE/ParE family toxin [Pseudomonadota bacterium]
MKLSLAPAAERELIEAAAFYAERADKELGLAFIAEFERALHLLEANPELGAVWRASTRRLPLRRFPYSLVYQLFADELRVIAVAHQRRRPGYWTGRR